MDAARCGSKRRGGVRETQETRGPLFFRETDILYVYFYKALSAVPTFAAQASTPLSDARGDDGADDRRTDERGGVVGSLAAEPEEPPAATKEGEGETERVSSEEKGGEEKPPEPEKKKRGRPKGSKNRPKETLLAQELPPKKAKKAAKAKAA